MSLDDYVIDRTVTNKCFTALEPLVPSETLDAVKGIEGWPFFSVSDEFRSSLGIALSYRELGDESNFETFIRYSLNTALSRVDQEETYYLHIAEIYELLGEKGKAVENHKKFEELLSS